MIYGPKNDGTYIVEFRIAKRKWLRAIIHEGDAEAVVEEKQEKALAEHVTRHPEDARQPCKSLIPSRPTVGRQHLSDRMS